MNGFGKITLFGSGNVAHHLARAFQKAQIPIERIVVRNIASFDQKFVSPETQITTSWDDLSSSDLIICCTSDDALDEILPRLAALAPVVTTSGTFDALSIKHQFPVGVFYPLQSFSKNKVVTFSDIPILLEASDEELMKMLKTIGHAISSDVREITKEQRQHIHLAAVFVNNFTNHLIDLAQQQLQKQNISPEIMLPLLTETVSKLVSQSAFDAQTGPARRNDQSTIYKHLSLLSEEEQQLYALLSASIKKRYAHND